MTIKDFHTITSIDIRGKFYIIDENKKQIKCNDYASISIPTSNKEEIKEVIKALQKLVKS